MDFRKGLFMEEKKCFLNVKNLSKKVDDLFNLKLSSDIKMDHLRGLSMLNEG